MLDTQLSQWITAADSSRRHSCAIISPHAAYDYSGPCAAHAFKQIDPSKVKRVFVLGPSHYLGLSGKCALSCADEYATPFYNIEVDKTVYQKLQDTGEFVCIPLRDDEDEHSLEMQLPYLAKVMESRRGNYKLVPIVVGALSPDREAIYGQIFASYLSDPENLFVISSDFCHWGHRFQYTYYDQRKGAIWESIKALDEEGMEIIERLDPKAFTAYLHEKRNTICGRHPIGVLLNAVQTLRQQKPSMQPDFRFVKYAQSEHCRSKNDSSVSYAAGSLILQ